MRRVSAAISAWLGLLSPLWPAAAFLMIRFPKTSTASAESVLRTAAAGVAEILGRDFWWENSFYPV